MDKKTIEEVKNRRPELKKKIDDMISDLVHTVKDYDPLFLLAPISTSNLISVPEDYSESTHEGEETIVEYLLNLVTAIPFTEKRNKPDAKIIDETITRLKEIKLSTMLYHGLGEVGSDAKEAELRMRLMLHTLGVRGPAYQQHADELFLGIASLHDPYLQDKLGFTASDLLEFGKKIEKQIDEKIRKTVAQLRSTTRQLESQLKTSASSKASSSELAKNFEELLTYLGGPEVFKINLDNPVDKKIANALSIKFGDNGHFLTGIRNCAGWPLNPSLLHTRPFVFHDGDFYCFYPRLLTGNLITILENLIEEKDRDYLDRFRKSRDAYLEKLSTDLITQILKVNQSDVHRNLIYPGGEVDCLVTYGDSLIIIEAKAGKFSTEARRGSILRFMSDMKDLLKKAYSQGHKTIEYVGNSGAVPFYDKHGNVVLEVNGQNYPNKFVISTYLEPIGHFLNDLPFMKSLGLIGEGKHWGIYINDLKIIVDILDHPCTFIDYLSARTQSNTSSTIFSSDEMDLFMLYVKSGLALNKPKKRDMKVVLVGLTEDLDHYYMYKSGLRGKVEKPRIPMPSHFEKLLEKLEVQKPKSFVSAALALLCWDDNARNRISDAIQDCEKKFGKDGRPHSLSLVSSEEKQALLLGIGGSLNLETHSAHWAKSYLDKGIDKVTVIYWTAPLDDNDNPVSIFVYRRS